MKIKFEINHFNPKYKRMQHNTFHKPTLEETIEAYEGKGFDVNNIRSINKKTTESIEFKHLLEEVCCLNCGEPTNRDDSFCCDQCKRSYLL
jgi:hypothetical protein